MVDLAAVAAVTLPVFVLLFSIPLRDALSAEGPVTFVARPALLVIPVGFVWFMRKRLRLNTVFLSAFLIAFLIPVLWYLPAFDRLSNWIYTSSYSRPYSLAAPRRNDDLVAFFKSVFYVLGGLPLLVLSVAGLLGFSWRALGREARKGLNLALLTISVPLIIGATTFNAATRYYFASFFLAYATTLYFALRPGGRLRPLRVLLVVFVGLFCLYWNMQVITSGSLDIAERFPLVSRNPDDLYDQIVPAPERDYAVDLAEGFSSSAAFEGRS